MRTKVSSNSRSRSTNSLPPFDDLFDDDDGASEIALDVWRSLESRRDEEWNDEEWMGPQRRIATPNSKGPTSSTNYQLPNITCQVCIYPDGIKSRPPPNENSRRSTLPGTIQRAAVQCTSAVQDSIKHNTRS